LHKCIESCVRPFPPTLHDLESESKLLDRFILIEPPSVIRLSRYCGTLNVTQPYGPPWPGTGIALPFRDFLFSTEPRRTLEPTHALIQLVPGLYPREKKRPVGKADNSPPSSAEVKNGGATSPLPPYAFLRGAWLIKHRDNYTFKGDFY
jgi:hypothetical protein